MVQLYYTNLDVQCRSLAIIQQILRTNGIIPELFQNLPDNTVNSATLGLLGVLPVQHVVEARALNLLVAFISDSESLEYKIALRQIGMKDPSSTSWFVYIQGLLHKYELGTVHQLLEATPSRTAWKENVKRAIGLQWASHCHVDNQMKQSLHYISPTTLEADKVVPIWESICESPCESHKDIN